MRSVVISDISQFVTLLPEPKPRTEKLNRTELNFLNTRTDPKPVEPENRNRMHMATFTVFQIVSSLDSSLSARVRISGRHFAQPTDASECVLQDKYKRIQIELAETFRSFTEDAMHKTKLYVHINASRLN